MNNIDISSIIHMIRLIIWYNIANNSNALAPNKKILHMVDIRMYWKQEVVSITSVITTRGIYSNTFLKKILFVVSAVNLSG